MLIYLDMCSIHRPLDDKAQVRIRVEGEAVLAIIALCESGMAELVCSDALEYEAVLKPLDALHLACAIEAGADYFCTCDDRLLKRARVIHSGPPQVVSPLELIREIGP